MLTTGWELQKTNIKTDTTLKQVHKNKKDIKVGDRVRLFLHKSKSPKELCYTIEHLVETDNGIDLEVYFWSKLMLEPSISNWSVSTTFTASNITVLAELEDEREDDCY